MKKHIALLLAAVTCLSGCVGNQNGTESTTTAETTTTTTTAAATTTSEVTTAAVTTTAVTTTEKVYENVMDMPVAYLFDARVVRAGPDTVKYFTALTLKEADAVISDNGITVDSLLFRESTLKLSEEPVSYTDEALVSKIETAYDIEFVPTNLNFADANTAEKINLESLSMGYNVKDALTTKAFVVSKSDGREQVIIDPAYMRGLPVYSFNSDDCRFEINGREIYMDSLCFDVTRGINILEPDPLAESDRYYYAEVTLEDITVLFDTQNGYSNSAVLSNIDIITDDTEKAINGIDIPVEGMDKDPEMLSTYNVLMDNIDELYTDDTYGIVLLDMDFDGTPEVLVSDFFYPEGLTSEWEQNYNGKSDVDIYRIADGKLKYIDTINQMHYVVYSVSNCLGLKTLPDGTKGWFGTAYKKRGTDEYCQVDYLYQLKGDKLIATEIFRREYVEDKSICYYYGEEIVPTVIHNNLTEEELNEPYASETSLEWNGVYSYFGEMWELYGFARQEFCKDITESYLLYSDWIVDFEMPTEDYYEFQIDSMERKKLSPRDVTYEIAYLVDAFYLGEYNPNLYGYNYRFLGDYAKPVIYLYPEEETEVSVNVELTDGVLTCTYPEYNSGWNVTAMPDGTLYDENGDEYYCLYWEGKGTYNLDCSEGFCVRGSDTAGFLREKLLEIGLTAREANEFIIYWLPVMQENPYNIITFHTEDYADSSPLTVSPAPDSVIRVFMTFTASDSQVDIPPQTLPRYERNGFTVVEWGGGEIK